MNNTAIIVLVVFVLLVVATVLITRSRKAESDSTIIRDRTPSRPKFPRDER